VTARGARHERGAALLAALIVLLVVAGSASTFIWFMDREQARAGQRMRAAAATALAEAGVHRALSTLESAAPAGIPSGRNWRPTGYSESVAVGTLQGRFTVAVVERPGGTLTITSTGQVAGVTRRVRARVQLTSPALLVALLGTSFVRLERPPSTTVILPYGAGLRDRPWVHIAAGRELWFATTDVSINDPARPLDGSAGPLDGPASAGSPTRAERPGPIRLLLPRGAGVTLDHERRRVDMLELRAMGIYLDGIVLRADALPRVPAIDDSYYRRLALGNSENASLNRAAGEHHGDEALARKRSSVYTAEEFEHVQTFLQTGFDLLRLRGPVYVEGGVALLEGQRLVIGDGTLITEGSIRVGDGASLEVTHSAATRTLPGVLVLRGGALLVTRGARARVHGLVFANGVIDVRDGASLDVVGAVIGADEGLSFRNSAASVVIRYDPAVLGTPGLLTADGAPVVAWVTSWEDRP
jgi:hypothetical protein